MHPNGRLTVVGIEAHGAGFHAGALGGVEEEASSAGEALAGPTARALLTAPVAAPAPPSAAVLKEAQGTVAHTCPTARDGEGETQLIFGRGWEWHITKYQVFTHIT